MNNSTEFKQGFKDGIPIALGYLAVAFSLGIQARSAGINAFYATLMSLLNTTSAGQFAGIGIIAVGGSYIEIALSQLVINLRYTLMSCSLSQKIDPKASLITRILMASGVTDEIFGISIARNVLNPFYTYGAMSIAVPGWALGTCLGVIMGNILPALLVNALSVALYGMFVAIVVPPAREKKSTALAVIIAMISSFACAKLPFTATLSSGTRVILLTIVISLIFAIIAPVEDTSDNEASANELAKKEVTKNA